MGTFTTSVVGVLIYQVVDLFPTAAGVAVGPDWLLGALFLAYWQSRLATFGLSLDGWLTQLLSGLLIGGGVLSLVFALREMRRSKTTVIPHREADALVTSGIFARTRNPIYLGDAMILLGFVLRWDAVLSLVLVPVFVWVIERRFIVPEEAGLRRKFRQEFAKYERKTRRWI